MPARKTRQRTNTPRGQGRDYQCECGQPSVWLMWCVQLNADDRTHKNFVPLCADCLELERRYNGEPASLTPAPSLQTISSDGVVRDAVRTRLAQHGPASSAAIAAELKLSYTSTWNAMRRMSLRGEIVVVNEVRQRNGRTAKIWSINGNR